MPFTKYAVETFISKKITEVTECNVADLYTEFPSAKKWLSSFGLMVIFVNQPREEMRPFALQFLRRVEAAFSEYALAREDLQGLVAGSRGKWSPYYGALYHFESALGQLYQVYDNSRKMLDSKLFESNDGSPLDRLNKIYNTSKHQVAVEEQPIWITNEGIETNNIKITFGEIEELLRACGRIAMTLSQTVTLTQPSPSVMQC
ncbi:MAG: hypothetical protein ACXW0H_03235 [Methylobacter sp.]